MPPRAKRRRCRSTPMHTASRTSCAPCWRSWYKVNPRRSCVTVRPTGTAGSRAGGGWSDVGAP
eukprot:2341229-Pyramimonas_sp.AAC.1